MKDAKPAAGIVVPRTRGRPRVAEPGESVSTWLTVKEHDRVIALAKTEEVSISSLVRSLLMLHVP